MKSSGNKELIDLQIGAPVGTARQRTVELLVDLAKQLVAGNRVDQGLNFSSAPRVDALQSAR